MAQPSRSHDGEHPWRSWSRPLDIRSWRTGALPSASPWTAFSSGLTWLGLGSGRGSSRGYGITGRGGSRLGNASLPGRLMDEKPLIRALIDEDGLTQARAAKLFGVTQPRISDLVRGKIELFSIDALVNMVAASGGHVDISIATSKDEVA